MSNICTFIFIFSRIYQIINMPLHYRTNNVTCITNFYTCLKSNIRILENISHMKHSPEHTFAQTCPEHNDFVVKRRDTSSKQPEDKRDAEYSTKHVPPSKISKHPKSYVFQEQDGEEQHGQYLAPDICTECSIIVHMVAVPSSAIRNRHQGLIQPFCTRCDHLLCGSSALSNRLFSFPNLVATRQRQLARGLRQAAPL